MEEQEDKFDLDLKELEKEKLFARLKRQNRRSLYIVIGLSFIDAIVRDSSTDYFEEDIGLIRIVAVHLFMLPILSFGLGLVPSIFPNKKLPFVKRYVNFSLFLLVILNLLFLAISFLGVLA